MRENEVSNNLLGAFIITYERPEILLDTINKLLNQSVPPLKIIVVDNSASETSALILKAHPNPVVEYYKVGYNAGPAGGAKIGLQRLAQAGYDWIYWGDDDNPPDFDNSFELLLKMAEDNKNMPVGVLGVVGQYFNSTTGNIVRVADSTLREHKYLAVDSIAGGMTMIVNGNMVRQGVLPEPALFFGFEELDFCLSVKAAGYILLVPTDLFLKSRSKYNRLQYESPFYTVKSATSIKRQYFSTRNSLWILKKHKLFRAYLFQGLKGIMKSVYGFRYGFFYGFNNFQILWRGILDGVFKSLPSDKRIAKG